MIFFKQLSYRNILQKNISFNSLKSVRVENECGGVGTPGKERSLHEVTSLHFSKTCAIGHILVGVGARDLGVHA
jgi:hypothetical protein